MPVDPQLKPASGKLAPTSTPALGEFYASTFATIRRKFETSGDGRIAAQERSALVDALLERLYRDVFSRELSGPENFCLVALGGYGRRELFPYSDIDLLFLSLDERTSASHREAIAAISRSVWDLHLRVGSSARTLSECGQLHRDNLEFNIALLDARYLAGEARLFARLREREIPHVVARDHQDLSRDLVEMTRHRHRKYGNTIFHLEPDLKESPGGLRDYQVARWLTLISQLEKKSSWAEPAALWPASLQADAKQALDYLSAARAFVHYFQGRDDNHLSYEVQDQAGSLGIGHQPGEQVAAAEWMRHYFRHARSIYRLASQLLEDATSARSPLYALLQDWKSRLSSADFSVARGRIFPRQPEAAGKDPSLLLRTFELMARHGLDLSPETERWVQESLPPVAASLPHLPELWTRFREILLLPRAAAALRAMHRVGLLVAMFPEFSAIDALVIRDFYHRYTVDEHSLMTIQVLKALRSAPEASRARSPDSVVVWEEKFSEILGELEQPELLFLALLFHDVGKGMPSSDHVVGSLDALGSILGRLHVEPKERDTVLFLVAQHLEMSATLQRRDIFDPQTVHSFAEKVGTLERLKMLCLLTYADIKSVNSEALTPWKAEMLWELFVETANHLTRSLDEERVHVIPGGLAQVQRILPLLSPASTEQQLDAFLEGFPKRYLGAHSAEEVAAHFELARRLEENPVQVSVRPRSRLFELTVLTADRPFLFASITGTLAAWGMNIVKADAFANASGTILDTFRFADLFRTLELNPSELERFQKSVAGVLRGEVNLQDLMKARVNLHALPRPKVKIETEIRFDNSSSAHSTLLELITQDRPGLLYRISSALAELGINIEVALIDTEGEKVIDVFYLTRGGTKLEPAKQEEIRRALLRRLQTDGLN